MTTNPALLCSALMDAQASQALLDAVQREAFCAKKKETRTIFIGELGLKLSPSVPRAIVRRVSPLRDAKRRRKRKQPLALFFLGSFLYLCSS